MSYDVGSRRVNVPGPIPHFSHRHFRVLELRGEHGACR